MNQLKLSNDDEFAIVKALNRRYTKKRTRLSR
jgi:hypothetical protein